MQQGPRCRDDSIAMLNRELDMVREGPVVGNLFILISVRHNEQRGKEESTVGQTSSRIVSATGRSSSAHSQHYLYTGVEF